MRSIDIGTPMVVRRESPQGLSSTKTIAQGGERTKVQIAFRILKHSQIVESERRRIGSR
jgi:hypothetical protein